MPKYFRILLIFAVLFITCHSTFAGAMVISSRGLVLINQIEGTVYDENRNPVYNAFVELYNDVNSLAGRTRTSTQGRFSFRGMVEGRYTIRVRPYSTNLLEESQDIEINNQTSRSDFVTVEFRLRSYKRKDDYGSIPGDSIYVQDVPEGAKKLYQTGIEKLGNGDIEGIRNLEAAIKIFPDYFDARQRVGTEYISRKEYEKGYPHLLAAIDLNQRCVSCYYSLEYAFYQLKQYPAAVKAGFAAAVLDQSSVEIHLLLGTVLRLNGDYNLSEKALIKALKLTSKPNSEIHWQLSLLYNKMNRNLEAANELETFLKLEPNSPNKVKIQELISKLREKK